MLKCAEFAEKTLYPITEFAPVENLEEPVVLKKKGKCKAHDRVDESGEDILMSQES